jgi:hypothetical protein
MPNQGWVGTLISSQIDSTAMTANGADTSILPPAAIFTLPANFLTIGSALRLRAWGRISNIVTTPGTLTFTVYFGAIKVFSGVALQLNAVAKTNVAWFAEVKLLCRSIGNGSLATLMGMGLWTSESVVGSPLPASGGVGTLLMPASAPAVGTGFDSTVSQAIDFRGNFSLTGNSILTHMYTLESLN